jgi:tyrosyl-tRNA synthetase
MLRKLMNMPDSLVRRYYELLTDLSIAKIDEFLKPGADIQAAKKDLAMRIIADFHPAESAQKAVESWGGLPDPTTLEKFNSVDPRLNRILMIGKLAPSVTEADKLIKSNSVALYKLPENTPVAITGPAQKIDAGFHYLVRAGKKWKQFYL